MTRTLRQKQISRQRQLARETKGRLACPTESKARFLTQDRAFAYALKASRDSVGVAVYLCRCQGWHLTTRK